MKIEVGKKYVQFDGRIVEILGHDGPDHMPFYDSSNLWRYECGWYCDRSLLSHSDLEENGDVSSDISHEHIT